MLDIINLAQIKHQIHLLFAERKIPNQVIFEDMEYAKIYWKKKRISAELIDDVVNRKEHFVSINGV